MDNSSSFNLNNYYTEFGGSTGQYFKRKQYIQLCDPKFEEKKDNFFSQYNKDEYQCLYYYEDINDIENCRIYGDLYFDLDGDIHSKLGFERLKRHIVLLVTVLKEIGLKEDEIEIYFSGAKGFHVIVPAKVLGIIPSTNLNVLYRAWAQYFISFYKIDTIDVVIYDRKRLFRIPNTTNSKTGLKKIRITLSAIIRSRNFDEFLFLIAFGNETITKKPRVEEMNKAAAVNFYNKSMNFYKKKDDSHKSKRSVAIPDKKVELLPCVKVGLETGVKEGNRNNTLVMLASAVMQSGYKLEETLDIMHKWNENNEKQLAFNEVELTVRSAYSMLLSGKKYGCQALSELGYCIGDECRIKEKRTSNG